MAWDKTEPMSWEYVAAFTDGEGYIGMSRSPNGVPNYKVVLYQNAQAAEVLFEIQAFLAERGIDGRFYESKRNTDKRHPTAGYYLQVRRQLDVYEFLTQALPYFRVKRVAAEAIMDDIEGKLLREAGG